MNKYQFYKNNYPELERGEINRKLWLHEMEQMEAMKMMEQAKAMQAAQAAMASGAGGGFGNTFYAFGTDNEGLSGYLLSVNTDGTSTQISGEFNGPAVFCKNPDNGILYFIEQDLIEEEMVVGTYDPLTSERVELDRAVLTAQSFRFPTSLFYLGNSQFIYLDNCPIFAPPPDNFQKIFVINIGNGGDVSIQDGAPLCTIDTTLGTILTSVFVFNEEYWVTFTPLGFPISALGKLDTVTPEVISEGPLEMTGFPFSDAYKAWFVTGITSSPNGTIYVNTAVNDKIASEFHFCVAELDVVNYTSRYIQEILDVPFTPLDIEVK